MDPLRLFNHMNLEFREVLVRSRNKGFTQGNSKKDGRSQNWIGRRVIMNEHFVNSLRLLKQAEKLIPAGVSKIRHPSYYVPGCYPVYIDKGKGSHVWDVDGNEYIDWTLSFGPIILGHSHSEVDEPVMQRIKKGFCFSLSHPIQNELAEKLVGIIPSAEMVKFVINGSDATAAAIRIARIYTKRHKVIRWGYHGWHDWCIGGEGSPYEKDGIPESAKQEILTFEYNKLDSLLEVLENNKDEVACIIMMPLDPSLMALPKPEFLQGVRELADKHEVVLIFDEVRSGFRMALGGAQQYYGVIPDMTTIGKAMANGYPISAVVGKKEIMQAAMKTRIIGTFFANCLSMVASLATISKLEKKPVLQHIWQIGTGLVDGLQEIICEQGIDAKVVPIPPMPFIKFTHKDPDKRQKCKDAFYTEAAKRGILLFPNHHWFVCYTHTRQDLDKTLEICRDSLKAAKANT